MAQRGSALAASAKACSDALYWNECSCTTPSAKAGWAAGLQELGNLTVPRAGSGISLLVTSTVSGFCWAKHRLMDANIRRRRAYGRDPMEKAFPLYEIWNNSSPYPI